MKERPILFQGAMVRALLPGTKTQTRRAMRPQPPLHTVAVGRWQDPPGFDAAYWAFIREGAVEHDHPFGGAEIHGEPWRCPYGQPGDQLWVRETWGYFDPDGGNQEFNEDGPASSFRDEMMQEGNALRDYWRRRIAYAASWQEPRYGSGPSAPKRWRPNIHMPRWACRIVLEVTAVRAERLQAISEADAIAEGIEPIGYTGENAGPYRYSLRDAAGSTNFRTAVEAYRFLWESINGAGSWDVNPWVWVVEFRKVAT